MFEEWYLTVSKKRFFVLPYPYLFAYRWDTGPKRSLIGFSLKFFQYSPLSKSTRDHFKNFHPLFMPGAEKMEAGKEKCQQTKFVVYSGSDTSGKVTSTKVPNNEGSIDEELFFVKRNI